MAELLKVVNMFRHTKCKEASHCNSGLQECCECKHNSRCRANCAVKCMLKMCDISDTCVCSVKDIMNQIEMESNKFEEEYTSVFQFDSNRR